MLCSSYIASFKDTVIGLNLAYYKSTGIELPPFYCLPDEGVNQEELINVTITFIENVIKKNPKNSKVNAATLILYGLANKYPCKAE